jgi:hypothetical protein
LQHWDYDADRIDGYDYDRGALMIRAAAAADEAELLTTLPGMAAAPRPVPLPLADRRPEVAPSDPKLETKSTGIDNCSRDRLGDAPDRLNPFSRSV